MNPRCLLNDKDCDPFVTDLHHIIRQQTIKRELPMDLWDAALTDRRNIVSLCRNHHHKITVKSLHLDESLAPRVREFARTYQLEPFLDRELHGPWTPEAA